MSDNTTCHNEYDYDEDGIPVFVVPKDTKEQKYQCGYCSRTLYNKNLSEHPCFENQNRETQALVADSNNVVTLVNKAAMEASTGEDTLIKEVLRFKWCRNGILSLINLRVKLDAEFKSTTKNKVTWRALAKEMNRKGFGVTSVQCSSKWRCLKSTYAAKKDSMGDKASGSEPIDFEFFEEMDQILGKKHKVQPLALAGSLEGDNVPSGERALELSNQEEPPEIQNPTKKRKVCEPELSEENEESALLTNRTELIAGAVPHLQPPKRKVVVKRSVLKYEQRAAVPLEDSDMDEASVDSVMDEASLEIPVDEASLEIPVDEEITIKEEPLERFADAVIKQEPDERSNTSLCDESVEKSPKKMKRIIVKSYRPSNSVLKTNVVKSQITKESLVKTFLTDKNRIVRAFPLKYCSMVKGPSGRYIPAVVSEAHGKPSIKKVVLEDFDRKDMRNILHADRFYTLAMSQNMQYLNLLAENSKLRNEILRLKENNTTDGQLKTHVTGNRKGPPSTNILVPQSSQSTIAKSPERQAESEAEPSTASSNAAEPICTTQSISAAEEDPKKTSRLVTNAFRIVDLVCFINSIFVWQHHHSRECPTSKTAIFSERLLGMKGDWTFVCLVCCQKVTIPTKSPSGNGDEEKRFFNWFGYLPEPFWTFTQEIFTRFKIPFGFQRTLTEPHGRRSVTILAMDKVYTIPTSLVL